MDYDVYVSAAPMTNHYSTPDGYRCTMAPGTSVIGYFKNAGQAVQKLELAKVRQCRLTSA